MERQYPCLEIHLSRLRHNAEEVIQRCAKANIDVCGIIKGVHGLPAICQLMKDAGAQQLGSSRIEQIVHCREAGIPGPYLLIRIPAPSELPNVVRYCDMSLQSEVTVLDSLEQECIRQGKTHNILLMTDLGDLREGFWDVDELVRAAIHVEKDLPHVHLMGLGVNLSCYGSIKPTPEKMLELRHRADLIETAIGRKLELISGGATSSYTLVHSGTMPEGINHLRIGENIILAKDLQLDWGITDMDYLTTETFTLKAEVIEIKNKPTYPEGEFCMDAFGRHPTYTDHGIRKRALLALGRADVGDVEILRPHDAGITIVGASSDHCILDIEDAQRDIKVGDIVSFSLAYVHVLYLTTREDIRIVFDELP